MSELGKVAGVIGELYDKLVNKPIGNTQRAVTQFQLQSMLNAVVSMDTLKDYDGQVLDVSVVKSEGLQVYVKMTRKEGTPLSVIAELLSAFTSELVHALDCDVKVSAVEEQIFLMARPGEPRIHVLTKGE